MMRERMIWIKRHTVVVIFKTLSVIFDYLKGFSFFLAIARVKRNS